MVSVLCTSVLKSLHCYLTHLRQHVRKFIKMSDISFCTQSKTPAWRVGLQQVSPWSNSNRLKAQEQLASGILCSYSCFTDRAEAFCAAFHPDTVTASKCLRSDSQLRARQLAQFAKLFSFELAKIFSSKGCNNVRILKQ